jgi:pimeloyl-ACP methyl ester carboxylesterase
VGSVPLRGPPQAVALLATRTALACGSASGIPSGDGGAGMGAMPAEARADAGAEAAAEASGDGLAAPDAAVDAARVVSAETRVTENTVALSSSAAAAVQLQIVAVRAMSSGQGWMIKGCYPRRRHRAPTAQAARIRAVAVGKWRLMGMAMTLVGLLLIVLGGAWLWNPDKGRAALEAQYAAPASGSEFALIDGVRLHLRDSAPDAAPGTPAVLMLHGFGSSLHTWEAWAQSLAPQMRVIRIDLPGSGLTGPEPQGDYSDDRCVRLLAALLDQRGIARASVVGHSMGGRLAWRFASAQPQRVAKLVLLAPDGFASPGFEYGRAPEVPLTAELMRYTLPRFVLRMSLEPAYADTSRLSEDTLTRYRDMLLAPEVRPAVLARMRQMVLQEPSAMLARITAPTLLVWGDADQMIPHANAQDYLRVMPQARLVLLPGLGHVPHEEAPAASLPAVQAFLLQTP